MRQLYEGRPILRDFRRGGKNAGSTGFVKKRLFRLHALRF